MSEAEVLCPTCRKPVPDREYYRHQQRADHNPRPQRAARLEDEDDKS